MAKETTKRSRSKAQAPRKQRVITIGRYQDFFHRRLWDISEQAAKLALAAPERKAGWENDVITALVFAFHTVEAYCNYVIQILDPVKAKEEMSGKFMPTASKVKYVMKLVKLPVPKDKSLLQTVFDLRDFRDLVVHGRSESKDTREIHDDPNFPPFPSPEWRRLLLPRDEFIKRLPKVETLLKAIHDSHLVMVREQIEAGTLPNCIWQDPEPLRGVNSVQVASTTLFREDGSIDLYRSKMGQGE